MKTRLEEVEELIAEKNKEINHWLFTNHFSNEPSPPQDMRKWIDELTELEIEKHDLSNN